MIKRYYRATIFAALLILTGCQIGTAPLSPQQLQDFVREKKIQPSAVADIDGVATTVLYKDAENTGCYVVWTGNGIDNRLKLTSAITSAQDIINEPVTALYHSTFGNDIVCLTINDVNLRNQASTIKIVFSDGQGLSTSLQNNGNMIISRKSNAYSDRVLLIIYDKDEKELTRIAF